ncbi:MAG: zinc ribbon domain-containing protein [Oscillospiraceae bacterium]|nr:zinc ribbon domain-containing protein [Oscillospiraceae bacterium]
MKCKKCGHENLIKAQYCSSCGYKFSDEERQAAYDKTFWGKLDKIQEAKEWITLDKITGSKYFKIALLILIILWGIMSKSNMGTEMMLLESDEYTVRYNSNLDEYYVFTDKNEVDLNLYLPGKPTGITVTSTTLDGSPINQEEYAIGDKVTLVRSDSVLYHVVGEYEKAEKNIDLIVYDIASMP